MLALVMVVNCTGQQKAAHYKNCNNSLSNDVSIMFQPYLLFEIRFFIGTFLTLCTVRFRLQIFVKETTNFFTLTKAVSRFF